ncbi:hypothetical protein ACIBG8_05000 [Nonomuraea sp. NPDC050556]|uniref:hypothetical protein n=1 Tax=Nonomuraea sp. NPDC050556 TaxID=3364369 RepID=UPI0037998CD4
MAIEYEYKWLLGQAPDDDFLDRLLAETPPPEGHPPGLRALLTQSSVYLDDDRFTLNAAGISLSVLLNHGAGAATAWVVCKETVGVGAGRRDAREVEHPIDSAAIIEALDDPELPPVAYVRSRVTPGLLRPYASVTQHRRKLRTAPAQGVPLYLSLDRCVFKDPGGRVLAETHWLEIEHGHGEPQSLTGLDGWAERLTAWLGRTPTTQSKPGYAAELGGARAV